MDALEQLNLAAPIVSTYTEIEETILCHIAEQLAANPDTLINATSEWRIKMLAQMGKVNKDTARIIASKVGKIPGEVQKVVQSSIDKVLSEYGLEMNGKIEESTAAALKNYDLQAVKDKYNQVNTVMQYKAKQAYVNGINSAADKMLKKKQKALENSQEYLDILNKNAMATVLGEKSRTEAIRETISEMSKKGIPAFVDKTGREWSPEAYVDMDIRNTAKNAALAAEFASLDELGQDIILVSSHSGSRPLCAPYQGKFYSISGKSGTITDAKGKTYNYTPLSGTSFGKAAGLFGINCGHRMRGVSDGTFINREKEFDGEETSEEYRKVQRQRELERDVRKKKTEANMYEASGDKDAARDLRRLAQDEDRKLRDYCQKEGLSYRRDRTEVYGYSNKAVDKSKESDIIKEKVSKILDVMPNDDRKSFLNLLDNSNEDIKRAYINYAENISSVKFSGYGGKAYYQPSTNSLIYSYPTEKQIQQGKTKYSTVAHEFGHFIDKHGVFSELSYKEIDALNEALETSRSFFKSVPSSCDQFLNALRTDKENLAQIVMESETRKDLFSTNASSGVQDALDGMFGSKVGMHWQHGDSYYNRKYNDIKSYKLEKIIQSAYKSLKMDASNQAKVKALVRNYETASEMWANIMSAVTCGGTELEYVKKYLPNSYEAYIKIMKGLK